MRYLIALMLFALPTFAQTTPATEPPPAPELIPGAPSYDEFFQIEPAAELQADRCRDGLLVTLFEAAPNDFPHAATQFFPIRPTEGVLPYQRLHVEPQSRRGPVSDPIKTRRECEDLLPRITIIT